ncbi:MAG: M15 family metallopeptidase [Thermoplasmata archaeon]|nr:M15 family metallopeptidase [Thermoplasmata archaeon]
MSEVVEEPENHQELLDRLLQISVRENHEALVPLREISPDIVIDISHLGETDIHREPMLRGTAALMLADAHKSLPEGYKFKIWEAFRPIEKQEFMRKKYLEDLKKANPEKPINELEKERDKYVARIDIIPPHLTGGAVDLTIVGPDNQELDMGTNYLDFMQETHTFSQEISLLARNNRSMLIHAMENAGFVNYSFEWWHFSYGDRYWAYKTKHDSSIYDYLKEKS